LLSGRVVVVTGASAGLGRATARAFGRRRARVGLLARGRDGLDAAAREIEAAGGQALALVTDVADPDAVERSASGVEERLGPIDVWVNCAMVSVFAPFVDIGAEEFERVTAVTYLGYANGTRSALKRMLPRDRGVVVQVGSALAYRAIPLQSAYCAAKHAIEGLTESVRCELLHDKSNVRICMVQMPALNTPQFDWVLSRLPNRPQPVPPIYQPEMAADAILLAAEHPRREIWIGETTTATLMANKVMPGLLDRYLGRTGYRSQQTDEGDEDERDVNLWDPVPGDHGTHGRFDDQSHGRSVQAWGTMHRGVVAVTAAVIGAVALRSRRDRSV
jgi:NAD(P)-dependent dehydrogenase (short-subunit alcohol dehydrogenase family)